MCRVCLWLKRGLHRSTSSYTGRNDHHDIAQLMPTSLVGTELSAVRCHHFRQLPYLSNMIATLSSDLTLIRSMQRMITLRGLEQTFSEFFFESSEPSRPLIYLDCVYNCSSPQGSCQLARAIPLIFSDLLYVTGRGLTLAELDATESLRPTKVLYGALADTRTTTLPQPLL